MKISRSLLAGILFVGTATAALAEDVSLEDLQGAVITTAVEFTGYFKRATGQGPGYITQRMRIAIGPGASVKSTFRREVTAKTRAGNKSSALSRSFDGTIGRPGSSDLGSHVWLLQGNSLILLKVMEVGGQASTIAFVRSGSSLTCTVKTANARETGAGKSKTKSVFSGKVVIVNMKQTSSTCRVTRKKQS